MKKLSSSVHTGSSSRHLTSGGGGGGGGGLVGQWRRPRTVINAVAIFIIVAVWTKTNTLRTNTLISMVTGTTIADVARTTTSVRRVIVLCTCPNKDTNNWLDPLDNAFHRLVEMVPEIFYARQMVSLLQNNNNNNNASTGTESESCEDFLEGYLSRLSPLKNASSLFLAGNETTIVEMIRCPGDNQAPHIRTLDKSIAGPPLVSHLSHPLFQKRSPPPLLVDTTRYSMGLHAPPSPLNNPMIRVHNQRNLVQWGEVFSSKSMNCDPMGGENYFRKLILYRSRGLTEKQRERCAVVHYPQILTWADTILKKRIETGDSPANETTLSMLTRQFNREEAHKRLKSKKAFCVILTMTTMKPQYAVDALVRHALARLLTEKYKSCDQMPMWKMDGGAKNEIFKRTGLDEKIKTGPWDTYRMQWPFKFIIAMPNEVSDGYLVEKVIHPYLAGSLGITIIPDVGKYVNANTLVSCKVDPEEIAKVNEYYRGNVNWMPFNTTPEMWAKDPSIKPIKYDPYAKDGIRDEPALDFVAKTWEEALQPCIDEIIHLDQDDDAYADKIMEPFLQNMGRRSMFDGTYLAISLLQWFTWAKSPLVEGLDKRLEGVDGMLEQTPGWGFP